MTGEELVSEKVEDVESVEFDESDKEDWLWLITGGAIWLESDAKRLDAYLCKLLVIIRWYWKRVTKWHELNMTRGKEFWNGEAQKHGLTRVKVCDWKMKKKETCVKKKRSVLFLDW